MSYSGAGTRHRRKSSRGEQHLIGILVSMLFLVPIVNLVAPVIGTAAGIHLFNRSFWKPRR